MNHLSPQQTPKMRLLSTRGNVRRTDVRPLLWLATAALVASSFMSLRAASAPVATGHEYALGVEHYEAASEQEIAAALAADVVVCVAANTPSGCR